MRIKRILYSLFIAAFVLSSCQKDIDQFVPDPGQIVGPDSTWYNSISSTMPVTTLKANLSLPIQKDSFELLTGNITVTAATGLQCTFAAGSLLTAANIPVTGKIYFESYLLKKKGDMIRMGTPTTSNGRMLVSGGEFFVRLVKDGSELHLSPNGHYYIRYPDFPIPGSMDFFNGYESGSAAISSFNWLPNQDTLNNRVYTLSQSYEILSNSLHWINCDYFYDTTQAPRTTVSAVLPAHYTNANTVAFTVFNDMRSVIGMYGDANTKKFSTGKLPSNKSITVIIISKQGNDYYLGHEQATTLTPAGGTVGTQQVTVNPAITSLDNIKAYLGTL